jgi:ABC-type thiamin/hydroxymethylpyrimidine transport system permease subunit
VPNKIRINKKILCIYLLLSLIFSTVLVAEYVSALPAVDSNATVTVTGSKTLTLTAADLSSMPTYTGVGSPRRNGGVFPLDMLGNYTGIPLIYICNLVGGMTPSSLVTVSTTVDGYTASLTYAQVHDSIYTQYNITTHEQISGQNPITLLAYGVNGTTLTSDGTNSDSDLGGPLRIIIVSNNGTSSILANDGMATFGNVMCKFVTNIEILNPGSLSFNTCDSSGTAKTSFTSGDTVFFSATGLSASTTYPVYVVQDEAAWAVRIPMPTRVSGSTNSVTTDSSGNIAAASIYSNAPAGQYAVIVDLNSDGKYDENDLLINKVATSTSTSEAPPTSVPSTSTASASPSPTTSTPEFFSPLTVALLVAAFSAGVITTLSVTALRKRQHVPVQLPQQQKRFAMGLATIATVDLVIMAVLAGLDLGTKQVIRPVISVVTEPLNIPGGAVAGGIYMMWHVVAIGIVRKPGVGTLTSLIESVISLIMPFGNFGILSFIIYLGPGVASDLVCLAMRNKADNLPTCILATGAANAAGTFLVGTTALALPPLPLMFSTILAVITGGIGGILAYLLLTELRKIGIGTGKKKKPKPETAAITKHLNVSVVAAKAAAFFRLQGSSSKQRNSNFLE